MRRLVSIGECMVEMAPSDTEGAYRLGFAGDTCNTAYYARRLMSEDWRIDYVTAVGRDALSDRMLAFLEAEGIGTGHVQRRSDRTVGLYLIELDRGERSFSYWRTHSAARLLCETPDPVEAALDGAEVAYVSGITLGILPPEGRDVLRRTLDRARGRGTRIVFDPNLRPVLWPDDDTMRAQIVRAAEGADVVLPSFDDEATFFGDATPGDTARRYAALGADTVVVKNGQEEMTGLAHGAISRHSPVEAEAIVDTTAAGDSFNAGFLSVHLAGGDLSAAIARGAEIAARVVAQRGAMVPVP